VSHFPQYLGGGGNAAIRGVENLQENVQRKRENNFLLAFSQALCI
jgi:hypothetical protein